MRQIFTKYVAFFPSSDGHKSLFTIYTTYRKKHKNTQSHTDFKNHDISILQINQIIFYLCHVTIFRNFVLSQATF